MLTAVQDATLQLLPARRRRSPSGWISFNAPCCQHRGESADTRSRGGIITAPDGSVTYHCFNCQYKTGYRPGNYLGYRFIRLLTWLGADENLIRRLTIESVRVRDLVGAAAPEPEVVEVEFQSRALPPDIDLVQTDATALAYCQDRAIDLDRYPLLVSARTEHNLNRRVIIPFTWNNDVIGYTARTWEPTIKPKYYSQYSANYVYNLDQQAADSQFVIVTEGPFDAMSIDGVAVLSNDCSSIQADLIESLNREIILVPDRDRAGAQLITRAQEYAWTVSFPVWHETCKDINEAVVRYGKLFVLKAVLEGRETSRLKIELKRRKLYS